MWSKTTEAVFAAKSADRVKLMVTHLRPALHLPTTMSPIRTICGNMVAWVDTKLEPARPGHGPSDTGLTQGPENTQHTRNTELESPLPGDNLFVMLVLEHSRRPIPPASSRRFCGPPRGCATWSLTQHKSTHVCSRMLSS
jgi:hypothetical protein